MNQAKTYSSALLFCLCLTFCVTQAPANDLVQLARDPDLSSDGKRLVFAWKGDIWLCNSNGGAIRQMTTSTSTESQPKFSHDDKTIAFISNRTGSNQVFEIPVATGAAKQLTFHTEGYSIEEFSPKGDQLLVKATRDHFWRKGQRFFLIDRQERPVENLVFDAYGDHGRMSPDGTKLLFTREGVRGYRKQYTGSQSAQIWLYDLKSKKFKKLCDNGTGARYPLWHPNGKEFFYVGQQDGTFNLYRRNLANGNETKLTSFTDDAVVMPTISKDGSTIVFRNLFDFYKLDVQSNQLKKIRVVYRGEDQPDPISRVVQSSAAEVTFSKDGLEMAFISGGDLWVMDSVLKEPKQITKTPEEERNPLFSADGKSIYFASDQNGQSDIWIATRADEKKYWWQNDEFNQKQLTKDSEKEYSLKLSPDGKTLAYLRLRGDIWLMNADGTNQRQFLSSWNSPQYDWSPDSRWIVYANSDNNFNRDVWVKKVDGKSPAANLSQHPDNESEPVWSPDGKMIAFTGRRIGDETDLYFVYLTKDEDETTSRDRKLKEALEKFKKTRKKSAPAKSTPAQTTPAKASGATKSSTKTPAKTQPAKSAPGQAAAPQSKPAATTTQAAAAKKKIPEVKIDFDGIADRIRRVSISNSRESNLFWSSDSKKLAFTATIGGKTGIHTISPPSTTAKFFTSTSISGPKWVGNTIYGLVSGRPATVSATGSTTSYTFAARQVVDQRAKNKVAFDMCWREMRDNFYDGNLNNKNWSAIRRKYSAAAENAVDTSTFGDVVNMMLGELNGSHLGFFAGMRRGRSSSSSSTRSTWSERTAHFGLRYDLSFKGPGLRVKDVIHNSPATKAKSRIHAGEIVLSINGTEVDSAMELTQLLNGASDVTYDLRVQSKDGKVRNVLISPISFGQARSLLYDHWIKQNQAAVSKASKDRFGYMHIQGMNMTSFYRFERELYSIANGKDGIVIDVRENGGGSTTDHLLTILTQPVHAITVPRGGGRGYPHDRKVYASWHKPIVVLCNQNSFSNAEIFSHAIKQLKRGRVVGVQTAGGVISTGGTSILDMGFLRKPFRGWYLLNGQDMELNGALPHFVIWPHPGDLPQGKDDQLTKAIKVLDEDVKKWKSRPQPKLIKASERRK